MKIAYAVGAFPSVSETFILNQICGACDRGAEVEIHTVPVEVDFPLHEKIGRYGLMERRKVRQGGGVGYLARILRAARIVASHPEWLPRWKAVVAAGRADRTATTLSYVSMVETLAVSDADIFHAQYGWLGKKLGALRAAGVMKGPLVASFRGGDTTMDVAGHPEPYQRVKDQIDYFLPISQYLAGILKEKVGVEEERLRIIPSGIDLDKFRYHPRRREMGSKMHILSAGRLVEKKGHEVVIRAVAVMHHELKRRVRLTIVGEGYLRPELESLIRELDLEAVVELTGWMAQEDLIEAQKQADVKVIHSITALDGDAEGLCNAVTEGMASGIPVISTWHGPIPEYVEHEKNGLLVKERDADALVRELKRLYDDPEWAGRLAGEARHTIEERFDLEKTNSALWRVYEELVGSSR